MSASIRSIQYLQLSPTGDKLLACHEDKDNPIQFMAMTVKPHIRLIKFRYSDLHKGTTETKKSTLAPPISPQQPVQATLNTTYAKPFGYSARGSGILDTQLPERYRRKPLDDTEIQYILRGGPE